MSEFFCAMAFIAACFGFYQIGWRMAHKTVATECKKLGKFYVDDEVFECVKVEKAHK